MLFAYHTPTCYDIVINPSKYSYLRIIHQLVIISITHNSHYCYSYLHQLSDSELGPHPVGTLWVSRIQRISGIHIVQLLAQFAGRHVPGTIQ